MGKHGGKDSDDKTTTDGSRPQGGSRGTGDGTKGNTSDGQRK
ncbi:hypothetical protein Acsp04_63040 [Actinomadura sp. NBRC 104425]|nr:hypothetical protein [Actinomadura sp. NBRC 104425]GLZ16069.1 hypothetical protein Acsp04_63040 [Actinomadura sp. NBRC 104425]